MSDKKKVVIIGGGTFSHVRSHLALAAPAFGKTAISLYQLAQSKFENFDVILHLTKMACSSSNLVTNEDVSNLVTDLINDTSVKIIFFNAAMCDFDGEINQVKSGKKASRLKTSETPPEIKLTAADKVIQKIRSKRKDIFLVGFKTTCDATLDEQFSAGLNLVKKASCNLVLANDIGTFKNMIVTPEDGVYEGERQELLKELVDIAYDRSHLTFTRSTVVEGKPVSWNSPEVYSSLRTVVNWCVSQNAYKPFRGATTGHFAAKISDNEFLTSIRKTNFNDIENNGLVRVTTDGPDSVISVGAKPSVGGQSQRIIFSEFSDTDCIVHFHCPLKKNPRDKINVMSQKEYECGSHECGQNTSNGLSKHGDLYAVMLDKHGPNIVFNHTIDPNVVIDFIQANFNLKKTTSGYKAISLDLDK